MKKKPIIFILAGLLIIAVGVLVRDRIVSDNSKGRVNNDVENISHVRDVTNVDADICVRLCRAGRRDGICSRDDDT